MIVDNLVKNAAARPAAFQIRARAYKDLVGNIPSFHDAYDETAHLYGVFHKGHMVASFRICERPLPCEAHFDVQPPEGSLELSRFSMDPLVKNPLTRSKAKIEAARSMLRFGLYMGATNVYIIVRPGRGEFYKSALGFKSIGMSHSFVPPAHFHTELLMSPFGPLYEKWARLIR